MTHKQLNIDFGKRSYPIYMGTDLLTQRDIFTPHIVGQQVMLVSNTTVAPLYLARLQSILTDYQCDYVELPDGEQYKDIAHWQMILDALLTKAHRRSTTVIALGGGVIGDISGFAAACYLRGVNFIQVPTTLLAQVDASVGGKTAVNHALGKNMIGAFYQPQCVVIDTATLTTLPEREYRAGLAEVIKYGLIQDRDFLQWLDDNMSALITRDVDAVEYAIWQSCSYKAQLVQKDEYEHGCRALLNLGHTFAHALETATHYQTWLHGEAVAIGLYLATHLSYLMGYVTQDDVIFVQQLLTKAQLNLEVPNSLQPSELLALMQQDKKATDAGLRFVVLKRIGEAMLATEVESAAVLACWALAQKRT